MAGSERRLRSGGKAAVEASVHRDYGRRLRGGAAVTRERAARHLRVGGQVDGLGGLGRHRRRRLWPRDRGGERGRFAVRPGYGRRGPTEPPVEHVSAKGRAAGLARRQRRRGRRDRGVAHVVVETAAPLAPAKDAAQFAVHATVAVREQHGRDDGVRGQWEQRDQRPGRKDSAAATAAGAVAGQRRPRGQLEHGVRRPARGRRDDDQRRDFGRPRLLPVTEHAGVRYPVSVGASKERGGKIKKKTKINSRPVIRVTTFVFPT